MNFGVRHKLITWLLLVILPMAAVGLYSLHLVDNSTRTRIETDLFNTLRIEAVRINSLLESYRQDVEAITSNVDIRAQISDARRAADELAVASGGKPGTGSEASLDAAFLEEKIQYPMQNMALQMLRIAQNAGTNIAELKIVDLDENRLGETPGFSWKPVKDYLQADAMYDAQLYFGDAFRNSAGVDRLGVAVPLYDDAGEIIGGILIELNLAPLTDLMVIHDGLGETSEAYIVQSDESGQVTPITQLRFDRDAAFTRVIGTEERSVVRQSLHSFGGTIVHALDYRGVQAIHAIQTLTLTDWGVLVKIDVDEAFMAMSTLEKNIKLAGVLALMFVVAGWFIFVAPIGKRLHRAANGADFIMKGHYNKYINDQGRDEISHLSRNIDSLAKNLDYEFTLRKEIEDKLRHQADHDELTGLANRKYGNKVIESLSDSREAVTVFFLDLDGFKSVNDVYGHNAGDEVLVNVAERLRSAVPTDATLARWGGDEFVIIEKGVNATDAELKIDQYQTVFDRPTTTAFGVHDIGCSIGNASAEAGESLEEALAVADELMYERKEARKASKYAASETHALVKNALASNKVDTWFQPVVDSVSSQLIGAEVLSRIRSENNALLTPGHYLTAINGSDIALEYDKHVISAALATFGEWRDKKLVTDEFKLSLNIMEPLIDSTELIELLERSVKTHDLSPGSLCIEIEEDIQNVNMEIIEQLRRMGVLVVLDNVGVGNSNLERLLTVMPDIVKIRRFGTGADQAFDKKEKIILKNLIRSCKELGIFVVLCGIESREHQKMMHDYDANFMQGFFFDNPSPADLFIEKWGCEQAPRLESTIAPVLKLIK